MYPLSLPFWLQMQNSDLSRSFPIKALHFGKLHQDGLAGKGIADLAALSQRKTDSDSLQEPVHPRENTHQYLEGSGYKEAI